MSSQKILPTRSELHLPYIVHLHLTQDFEITIVLFRLDLVLSLLVGCWEHAQPGREPGHSTGGTQDEQHWLNESEVKSR